MKTDEESYSKFIFMDEKIKEKYNELSFYEKEVFINMLSESIRESLLKINSKLQ